MVKITRSGSGALRRLSSPAAMRQITAALYAAGQEIETTAALSITSGSVSGRGHIVSKPGEPPNSDTHVLDLSIETNIVAPGKVEVSANAPYAAHDEFGTSKMAARPYMRPAANAKRDETAKLVADAVSKVLRGGTVTR